MNVQVLIDSIVRQVTVLIAQLATSGGIRAPMAHLANQVFVELSKELQAQGISRKVSADMFGMALRAYIRKLRRLGEGKTELGKTLWEAVLDFIKQEGTVTRDRVLQRFARDDELQVQAILRDLTESGLVFGSGAGPNTMYRAATDSELGQLSRLATESGLEELIWVILYRSGPLTEEGLLQQIGPNRERLPAVLQRLYEDGRVERQKDGTLVAQDYILPLGSPVGWEAAVFDHIRALVQTVCQRLRLSSVQTSESDVIGGSTYGFDVWPGHPMEEEVKGQLREIRRRCTDLRQRVDAYNRENGRPENFQQVVLYAGQNLIEQEKGELEHSGGDCDA
ncbi:MAG: hypothetical protein JXA30_20540 [Deltaproteobacteria bacterium]|nr:hypothetical protein [Deltaproteobacteria bacterium]